MQKQAPASGGASDRARELYRAALAVGLVLLVLALGTGAVFPKHAPWMPEGLRTPIVAFELVRSVDEVERLFGAPGSPERAAMARAMDLGNTLDYPFLLAYGAFLALLSGARALAGSRAARFAVALSIVAAAADAFENTRMLAITARLGSGGYDALIGSLSLATSVKWLALAAALLLLAPSGGRLGGWPGRCAAAAAVVTGGATVAALTVRSFWAEVMLGGVSVALLALWVESVRASRRPAAEG